jgi:sugar phosphate isomerase/epimerase
MRRILALIALFAVLSLNARKPITPRVSIFADHIYEIAHQENISFREAAQRVKALGYTGVDVWVSINSEDMRVLDELGFEHASAIAHFDYSKGDQSELENQTLSFMKQHGFPRVLVVPGLLPEQGSEQIFEVILRSMDLFSRKGYQVGLEVTIEDYDNPRSPCYNTEALDRMFKAAKRLGHTFDTGNYLYCGEDVLQALKHFRKRVKHVHLKDRVALRDGKSPAVGTGLVPLNDIISQLVRHGYKGWFTVEHFGSPHMLQDAETSIRNVLDVYELLKASN